MKNKKILTGMRRKMELNGSFPTMDDTMVLELYNMVVSVRQQSVCYNGKCLEDMITGLLDVKGIGYRSQVSINHDGIVMESRSNCHHILDIVIGDSIDPGSHISDYKVLSCKTSCRERWLQDNQWSFTHPPILYALVTLSDDYPSSERFKESDSRCIVTEKPKLRDDRIRKVDILKCVDLL
jgi:hypothetical protein